MNRHKLLIAMALVACAIGIAAYAVHRHLRDSESELAGVQKGGPVVRLVKNPQPVPPFQVQDLDGKSISPADLHGKVVLLNFWATWCPPCRQEIPELIGLQDKYRGQLQVIGISEDDDPPATVRAFAQQKGINYPIVMATAELEKQYGGVPALPTTFVVDEQGRVVQRHTGLYPVEDYTRELAVLMKLPTNARVENFEDTGQVFLQNVSNATSLPDVDLSGLTDAQKKHALRRMNAEACNCGCKLTVAECRLTDSQCPVSTKLAAQIVDEVRRGVPDPPADSAPAEESKPPEKNDGSAGPAKPLASSPQEKNSALSQPTVPRG